jgi:gamma-glutamylcyclotransferase (GGCT)/AIG2-like uncharacterized protein YtfP
MSEHLFVYGTLLPGRAPAKIAPAVDRLRVVGTGFVHGTLYHFGRYPGAILDSYTERRIYGTVFLLPEDARPLAEIDRYEGFNPKAPDKSLFLRVAHPVGLESGEFLVCWIYVYNRDPAGGRVLERGRYPEEPASGPA